MTNTPDDFTTGLGVDFEKGLRNLAKVYAAVRRRENIEEAPPPKPPFEHAIALLEAAWESVRKLHPIFVWHSLIAEGREPSRWQWSRTVDALQRAGFKTERHPHRLGQNTPTMRWYNIPPEIFKPFREANPDNDALDFMREGRTRMHPETDMNLIIGDACRVWTWAYFEGLVPHPGEPE